ncbi:Transferase OS=Streptomyces alboniger OX=132473 GN=CP975_07230 PE=4 SV=1 [Streptomyces alboniger]
MSMGTEGTKDTEGTAVGTEPEARPRVGCAVDTDGRITFDVPSRPAEAGRLLLRLRPKKGQPEKTLHVLDLEPAGDGRRRAVLDTRPVLAEGRWDVFLLQDSDSPRLRLLPGLRNLRVLVDGHLRDRQSPLAVRVPYVTKDGHLAIRAWRRTAHAEAAGIEVTDRSMTVGARLHGAWLKEGAVVRLRRRGGDGAVHTLEPRAQDDGRSFSFTVDYEKLATGADAGGGIWDAFVQPGPEASPIRMARLLDDVADRKEVFGVSDGHGQGEPPCIPTTPSTTTSP